MTTLAIDIGGTKIAAAVCDENDAITHRWRVPTPMDADAINHHIANIYHEAVAAGHDDIVSISSHAKWRYENWNEWPLDQKFFSMGETMAHLVHLVCEGKIKQTICGDEYRFELP